MLKNVLNALRLLKLFKIIKKFKIDYKDNFKCLKLNKKCFFLIFIAIGSVVTVYKTI